MNRKPMVPAYVRDTLSHAVLRPRSVAELLDLRAFIAKCRPSLFLCAAARQASILLAYDRLDARVGAYLVKAERREYLALF